MNEQFRAPGFFAVRRPWPQSILAQKSLYVQAKFSCAELSLELLNESGKYGGTAMGMIIEQMSLGLW